ncbi:MAG: GGDEF domain-containing protein [Gammaproteobacteria bacterium]|nr:GGDEF domain-containing protein [Gammaproteobacteria bacterium]
MNTDSSVSPAAEMAEWHRARLLRAFGAFAPAAPVSTLAGCAALLVVLWPIAPPALLTAWFNAGLLLIAVQVLMWRALERARDEPAADPAGRRARRWFVLGSSATGLFWCAGSIALFPDASLVHQAVVASVLAAVCAVWLPLFALDRTAVAAVAAPALLPMASGLLLTPYPPLNAMGSLLFLLFAVLLGVAFVIRRVFDADHAAQQALYQRATYDSLVGLVNRDEFHRRIDQLGPAPRGPYAVVFIDLDHFKEVNDTAGHAEGDRVLREVGAIVRQEIRKADTGARVGGDEFAVLMHLCTGPEALRVAGAILNRINALPWASDGTGARVTASIGIACSSDVGGSTSGVLEAADQACYAAKQAGRNRVEIATARNGRRRAPAAPAAARSVRLRAARPTNGIRHAL